MTKFIKIIFVATAIIYAWGCRAPQISLREADSELPDRFISLNTDTANMADLPWRAYFDDPYLIALIDTALSNNQELNIIARELEVSRNEILEKEGEYQPFVNIGGGIGTEKAARYTRGGAVEHELEIKPEKEFPDPLGDFMIGATASWELDIWKKLRNAKSAAEFRYLAHNEGRNFLVTQLIAEIAESYYELIALDNLLEIINQNVKIQDDALRKVRLLKENAEANQLAVNRFEAQLLNTQNQQYAIRQKRVMLENRINFLAGRYPQSIDHLTENILNLNLDTIRAGIPAQLLRNRSDVRQAEYHIAAANLDVEVARANFFPSLDLKAGVGLQAFNPTYLLDPKSLVLNFAGDIIGPLINKKAITAQYNMANSLQIQAAYIYEQTLLNAYIDVLNQLSRLENYSRSLNTKFQEVEILNQSVRIANNLFKYAKADYVEVLLTQEEVLEAQMELIEIKLQQLNAKIQIYRALGGGWQ